MSFHVYILRSLVDGSFCKGFSNDVFKRLDEHNKGLSSYTSTKLPWKLVYYETVPSKNEAVKKRAKPEKTQHSKN